MLLSSLKRPLFCQARLLSSSSTSATATTLWGHVDVDVTSMDSTLGFPTTDLKNMPIRKALRAADRLIPCLSVPQTPPIRPDIDTEEFDIMIPSDKIPKGLVFDEKWLDVALDHVFNDTSFGPSFGDNVPDFNADVWLFHPYTHLLGSRLGEKGGISDIMEWMRREIEPSSNIHRHSRWRGAGQLGSFDLAQERWPTRKPLLTLDTLSAASDLRITWNNESSKLPFETRQIRPLPTVIELVRKLELEKTKQGSGKVIETTDFTMPNLFKEAYFSSVSDNAVFWIGHPALYTVGYSRNGYLYLSNWRSSNPERVAALLHDSTPISQAEFTAETLTMAALSPPQKLDAFLEKAHRPPSIPIAHLDTWASHIVSKTIRAVQNLPLTRVVLGGVEVYGHWTEESELPNISTTTLTSFPKAVDLDPKTWENALATAKIVSSKALQAQRELQGIEGIPTLYGSLEVAVSDPSAHGTSYPFYVAITANVGPSLYNIREGIDGAVGDFLDDEILGKATRKILGAMHERGWRYHHVSAHNTLQDKDGQVYLTNFGMSMRVEECDPAINRCDDGTMLAERGSDAMNTTTDDVDHY